MKYQAVQNFATNQALWQQWKSLYTDLTNPNREEEAKAFYEAHQTAMLEGTAVLWPEGETYLMLQKSIVNEGQASFQSEKQNDPYDPTPQIFDMKAAKRFKVEYGPAGECLGYRWLDESNRFVPEADIVRTVAFHDPALAEGKDGNYAAIVVCASDRNGYLYCLDTYIEKVPPSRQIEQAFALHDKWQIDTLYLESNCFQCILKDAYWARQGVNCTMRVTEVKQHHNKEKRISSLEPLVTNGRLVFNQDLNPSLISQMQLFLTDHDDGPDALQEAVKR